MQVQSNAVLQLRGLESWRSRKRQ